MGNLVKKRLFESEQATGGICNVISHLQQPQGGIGKPGPTCEAAHGHSVALVLVKKKDKAGAQAAHTSASLCLWFSTNSFSKSPLSLLVVLFQVLSMACSCFCCQKKTGIILEEPTASWNCRTKHVGSPVDLLSERYLGFSSIFGVIPPWLGAGCHSAAVIAPVGSLFFRVLLNYWLAFE